MCCRHNYFYLNFGHVKCYVLNVGSNVFSHSNIDKCYSVVHVIWRARFSYSWKFVSEFFWWKRRRDFERHPLVLWISSIACPFHWLPNCRFLFVSDCSLTVALNNANNFSLLLNSFPFDANLLSMSRYRMRHQPLVKYWLNAKCTVIQFRAKCTIVSYSRFMFPCSAALSICFIVTSSCITHHAL